MYKYLNVSVVLQQKKTYLYLQGVLILVTDVRKKLLKNVVM